MTRRKISSREKLRRRERKPRKETRGRKTRTRKSLAMFAPQSKSTENIGRRRKRRKKKSRRRKERRKKFLKFHPCPLATTAQHTKPG